MDTEPDPEEAARRLRAAIAYVGVTQEDAAKALGVSVATLARMLARKGIETRALTWAELWRAADNLGLPRAWFTADIARIHEVVPDEMPHFPGDARWQSANSARRAALAREEQELRREAQRSSARQSNGPDTKRARHRRRSEGN